MKTCEVTFTIVVTKWPLGHCKTPCQLIDDLGGEAIAVLEF
jgi:hypothetical protein